VIERKRDFSILKTVDSTIFARENEITSAPFQVRRQLLLLAEVVQCSTVDVAFSRHCVTEIRI
jgi:hypothetical protein